MMCVKVMAAEALSVQPSYLMEVVLGIIPPPVQGVEHGLRAGRCCCGLPLIYNVERMLLLGSWVAWRRLQRAAMAFLAKRLD